MFSHSCRLLQRFGQFARLPVTRLPVARLPVQGAVPFEDPTDGGLLTPAFPLDSSSLLPGRAIKGHVHLV